MNFLTNRKPKLFRSREEGNMIVYLSNISFTPNKTLDRQVWDFSAILNCSKEHFPPFCSISVFKDSTLSLPLL